MTTLPQVLEPPRTTVGAIGWLRQNLFNTWYNTLLTLLTLGLIYVVLRGLLDWASTQARWGVVTSNLRLFMVGQYPPDQVWRVGMVVLLVSILFGLSWAAWRGVVRTFAVALAGGFLTLAVLPFDLTLRLYLLGNAIAVGVGFIAGRRIPIPRRWLILGWVLSFPIALLLLGGIPGFDLLTPIGTQLWGGLLLTFLLAVTGIVASFPLGVMLALGRRSALPTVKAFSILYIETVRGVPLITVLFMADIMVPLFMPEGMRIDRLIRAMVGIILFEAAYLAENVRGGLQAIPQGQYEAAKAVGLNPALSMGLIILPQALRNVIPSIVGQFISLFKDTSLVAIIGLLELLNIGRAVLAQPQFLGTQKEVYLFVALVYWIFTFSMSWASRQLEVVLGVGKR